MLNKKNKLFVFGLSALLAGSLMACSTVKAVPPSGDYDEKPILVDNNGNKIDVSNNTMKQIYDALVSEGDSNSEKVLNNVLVIYSKSVFGDFLKEVRPTMEGTDDAAKQALANKYEIYHDDAGNGSVAKLNVIYTNFMSRVMKTFYSYVTNSSYQERSQFIEKKFYDAQVKNNYSLGAPANDAMSIHKQVDGSFHLDERDASSMQLSGYFSDIFATYGKDKNGDTESSYIELAVLPEIYRDELVINYLYQENYRTLGISYARKVNYIKLADNSAYPTATKNLVQAYANNVIEKNLIDKYPFTVLNDLAKGTVDVDIADDATITNIYDEAGWNKFSAADLAELPGNYSTRTIYKESTLGGYISDYLKMLDTSYSNDSDIIKDFTNSGAYTPATGLAIKEQSLIATDNTVSGWYTSTGLSDIPSDTKNRIFNMGVANEVDVLNKNATDGKSQGNYVYYRNGEGTTGKDHYLVTLKNAETGNQTPYLISDNGSWYLFDVQEAVKSSKLSKSDESNYYDVLKNESFYGDYVARAIAATLSSSDTYKKSSNQYFVKKMALVYHDQSVYDYFKKTFPDLFE